MGHVPNNLINAVALDLLRLDLVAYGVNAGISQRAYNRTIQDIDTRHVWSWRKGNYLPATSTLVTGDTVADLSGFIEYPSSGIQVIYGISLAFSPTSVGYAVSYLPPQQFQSRYGNVSGQPRGKPAHYWYATLNGSAMRVYWSCPLSNNFYCQVEWGSVWPDVTDFTAQVTRLPDRFVELVELGMAARMARFIHAWDVSAGYTAEFERRVAIAIDQDRKTPVDTNYTFEDPTPLMPIGETWKDPMIG